MNIEFCLKKKLGQFQLNVKGEFQGGITGIFGESGAGKTTLLNCLAGVVPPDEGSIRIDDKTIYDSKSKMNVPLGSRKIGVCFQDALLFDHLSVKQNIEYGRKTNGSDAKVKETVDLLNLYGFLSRRPRSLSGGERQRVALARTLIYEPAVLFMDEPLTSLDLKSRYQIIHYLREAHERWKLPIVFVSHSVSEMLYLAKHVLVIHDGKNVSYGPAGRTLLSRKILDQIKGEAVENILDLPVREYSQSYGLVHLRLGEQSLHAASPYPGIHPRLKVGIKASDIMVAAKKFDQISARNCLRATLTGTVPCAQNYILLAQVNEVALRVEITRRAFEELKLALNQTIYLIIKASSIIIYH